MIKLILEIDTQLYRLLQSAARSNHLSFDEECRRRLEGTEAFALFAGVGSRAARR
jgi:hypothetical protein